MLSYGRALPGFFAFIDCVLCTSCYNLAAGRCPAICSILHLACDASGCAGASQQHRCVCRGKHLNPGMEERTEPSSRSECTPPSRAGITSTQLSP
mmetsp:Transcript_103164/g.245698  ORF Transcript_103164/g.245698 Transcript_103164/m.245698 type:complete len:95 (+) Transcript_103164:54-338(+)